MKLNILLSSVTVIAITTTNLTLAENHSQELEDVEIILEVNETDQDAEIVLNVNSDDSIQRFSIWDPDGVKILHFGSHDRGWIGLSEVIVETGEPDILSVLNAYPEGKYKIRMHTMPGEQFGGKAVLSHDFLPAPIFSPSAGELVEPKDDLIISWDPVDGAQAYSIEIEQDDLEVKLSAVLDGDKKRFVVPAGFLLPGVEYEIGMATVAANGNIAVAEGGFETTNETK